MSRKAENLFPVLVLLLVAQLLLAFWLAGPADVGEGRDARLLAFDKAAVDAIEIRDAEGKTLLLQHAADGWRLPGHYDFPVAAFRVQSLLDSLSGLRRGLAVATSAEAAKRFHVSEDGFERRIRLLRGETELAVLYLGDAAGPRRAYGRVGGEEVIYPLAITTFDAGSGAGEWTDKSYLHRDARDLEKVGVGGLELYRAGDGWRLADLAEAERMDGKAADELVRRLTQLNFMSVVGMKDAPPKGRPLLHAQLVFADGREVDYRFTDPGRGGDPLLTLSDRDHVLRIGSYAVKPLLQASRDKLLKVVGQKAAPPAETQSAAPAGQAPSQN